MEKNVVIPPIDKQRGIDVGLGHFRLHKRISRNILNGKEWVNVEPGGKKMSKYLLKLYPVAPAQHFQVWNLDVLEDHDYCSKTYQEEVRAELNEYEIGLYTVGIRHGVVSYNNKSMKIVEANFMQKAIEQFFEPNKEV